MTETVPKSLLLVAGVPFIDLQLQYLKRQGARRVVLCVGYLGEALKTHVGDGSRYGLNVEYSWDGKEPLGTGGAVRKAACGLGDSAFFVLYGDSYVSCDLLKAQETLKNSPDWALMTVFKNENKWVPSNVEIRDGRIVKYSKEERTPRMKHVDYGLGLFLSRPFMAHEFHDLASAYRQFLKEDRLSALEISTRFYEIGSPQGLQELEKHLKETA